MEPLQSGDPQRLGEYALLGRLGAGAMGEVFLGRSPGGFLVAIKVIRPELARDPEFRARFAQEVAAARRVSGLFTALVVDASLDGPVLWLVTAFVDGPTLATAVEDHGPLPLATVQTLAAGLAEALRAIHAQGIVHRDLKPANVMLAAEGPRVIDFGIARALEGTVHTATGLVLGTPAFMSPEQATGREVGPPSDIFSLGSVLAFAASGKVPFGEGAPAALLYRVVSEIPDTGAVPGEIRPLIDRCLAKEPSDRPSAAGLLAELGTASPALDWLPSALARQSVRLGHPRRPLQPGGEHSGPRDEAGHESEARPSTHASPAPGGKSSRIEAAHAAARQRAARNERALGAIRDARQENKQQAGRGLRGVSGGSTRRLAEAGAQITYEDLLRVHTAPEFGSRLRRQAAMAEDGTAHPATWPASAPLGDLDAIRAGRLIPSRKLLDAFLVSCGVSPDHLDSWHSALVRVTDATAGVINLRTRAIEFTHALDRELKAFNQRSSSNAWTRVRTRRDERRRDPAGVNRASRYGQLYGQLRALVDDMGSDPYAWRSGDGIVPPAPYSLTEAVDEGSDRADEPYWLAQGIEGIKDAITLLAAVQVDASGVDLTGLNLPERDAVLGVIWTDYTKWPAGAADAIRARSILVRNGVYKIT